MVKKVEDLNTKRENSTDIVYDIIRQFTEIENYCCACSVIILSEKSFSKLLKSPELAKASRQALSERRKDGMRLCLYGYDIKITDDYKCDYVNVLPLALLEKCKQKKLKQNNNRKVGEKI